MRALAACALLSLVVASASTSVRAAERTGGLGRSFAKLSREKCLTIGYFGGSITEGAGASDASKTSWRALTTAWFREQFPSAQITEVNAAIGGTGSDLGAFRIEDDLLSKKPDLVFVEYAVNDGGADETRTLRSMEGIVRHIWRSNPTADICFVYTTTKSLAGAYDRGETPKAVLTDERVAEHYGIPSVNVGKPLWEAIHEGTGTWESLTVDTVHPNDTGYRLYMDVMSAFLARHRRDRATRPMTRLPEPLTTNPLENGRLVDTWSIDSPGWAREEASLAGRYPHRIAASQPDTRLTYRFKGSAIGLYWIMGPDSGDIEWSIDGGAPQRRSAWDIFAKGYARANYALLADNLTPGEHTLNIRILADHNPESKGTWIRIGAFMVQ